MWMCDVTLHQHHLKRSRVSKVQTDGESSAFNGSTFSISSRCMYM